MHLPEYPGSAGPADPEAWKPDLRHHRPDQWSTTSRTRVSFEESNNACDDAIDEKIELGETENLVFVTFVTP